jgi:hypothetical protein
MLLIQPTRDGNNGFFPQLVTGRSVWPYCTQAKPNSDKFASHDESVHWNLEAIIFLKVEGIDNRSS